MQYHAHVYWQNEHEHRRALRLRENLAELGCELGRMIDQPVGPHPLPSYQASFDHSVLEPVRDIISHTGLTALVHEETGNDMRDHTQGASWIGQTLQLDLAWLAAYVEDKNKANI